jgi:hypothetical protein
LGIGLAVGGLAAGAVSGSAGAAATQKEKAQAKHALVGLSDLPQGWTSKALPSTSASGGSSFTGSAALARCLGVPTKLVANNPPKQVSPVFENPGSSELVQETVSIYPSPAYAKAVFDAISSHKAAGCISSLLNKAEAGAQASGRFTVARVSSPKGTAAFTLGADVSGGSTPTTTTEIVYFVHGQYGSGLDVETSGAQAPAAFTTQLLATARARL